MMNDSYIITNGKSGCNIPYMQIRELAQKVISEHGFSSPIFWMWKMFQLGFAYGKHEERAKKKSA